MWIPQGWTSADWSAFGSLVQAAATVAAFVVAVVAAMYAKRQWKSQQIAVSEAREREDRLREEQARPFVVVDFEPSPVWGNIINLVVENVGKTLAKNVRFEFDPPLQSSMSGQGYDVASSVLLTQGIPAMPPGKRVTALFDMSHDRIAADLPMTYRVTVRSDDSADRSQEPLEYVLDLSFRYGLRRVEAKTVHDVAKTLKEIEKQVSRWTQHLDGIRVWVRDEDAYLAAQRAEYETHVAEQSAKAAASAQAADRRAANPPGVPNASTDGESDRAGSRDTPEEPDIDEPPPARASPR